jgi:hypothetical protein
MKNQKFIINSIERGFYLVKFVSMNAEARERQPPNKRKQGPTKVNPNPSEQIYAEVVHEMLLLYYDE